MLVSIVVPIYNTALYLEKCLDSIKDQTYNNIEVILINDGSTDESSEIAEKYVREDIRFRLIHLVNGGVSRARNKGIEIASGKYITFIDSDDVIKSNHIEKLVKCMPKKEGLCICNYIKVFSYKNEVGIKEISEGIINPESLVKNLPDVFGGYNWNKLYVLEVIKSNNIIFDEEITLCEDLLFTLQYLLAISGEIYYIQEPTYLYLQRQDSAVATFNIRNNISSLIARKRCVDLLKSSMPMVLDKWMRETLFVCFSCRRICMSHNVKEEKYVHIMNTIITEMYDEVFLKSKSRDRIKLYIYKNHLEWLVFIKKICGEKKIKR